MKIPFLSLPLAPEFGRKLDRIISVEQPLSTCQKDCSEPGPQQHAHPQRKEKEKEKAKMSEGKEREKEKK